MADSLQKQGAARRLLIIYNPTAGGSRRRRFEAVLADLADLGCPMDVRPTTGPGDAAAFAREADAAAHDLVVAAGGDGTINEVINGLSGSQVALGIVPLGTANLLAREIGLTRDPDRIAAAIAGGALRRVSLGRVVSEAGRGRHFTLMAGVGFDAHVVADVDLALKRRIGKGAYVAEFARQLFAFKFPAYRVTVDGATHQAASVVIAKPRHYGGPYSCAKDARLEDTEFHVCLFERPGALAAIRYGMALTGGRLEGRGDYRILRVAHVRVEGPAGDPVQGDGDVIAALPLAVEMAPAALRLIVPG